MNPNSPSLNEVSDAPELQPVRFPFAFAKRAGVLWQSSLAGDVLTIRPDTALWAIAEARRVIGAFIRRYNTEWLIARLGYRTPAEARATAWAEAA